MTFKRILIACLTILVVLAGLGVWLGRPAYHHWKENRFLAQARAFAAKSQDANAWLSCLQALNLNRSNVETYRLLADLADRQRSPEAVYLRRKVVELEPGALSN